MSTLTTLDGDVIDNVFIFVLCQFMDLPFDSLYSTFYVVPLFYRTEWDCFIGGFDIDYSWPDKINQPARP